MLKRILRLILVFGFVALTPVAYAAQYDVPIQYDANLSLNGSDPAQPAAVTDALLLSQCYQAANEPYGGIACRPEDKFIQELGGVVTCADPADLKILAESQQNANRASFNCFTNQASAACRAGYCSNSGTCIQATSVCPSNLNRVNLCPGSCGTCNADAVYCPVPTNGPQDPGIHQGPNYAGAAACQLKQYGPGGGVLDPTDPQSCASQGRSVANYCTGECTGCAAGFTESGRNRGACIPFAQRFIEMFEDGLTSLGGPADDGAYDYSVTGPANLSPVYLKADVAENLNFANASLPISMRSVLLGGYTTCTSAAQCGAGQQCSNSGLCYLPTGTVGSVCSTNSDCNILQGHVCDPTTNQCAIPVSNCTGLLIGGQCNPSLTAIQDPLDNLFKLWDGSKKYNIAYADGAPCSDGQVLAWNTTNKIWECADATSYWFASATPNGVYRNGNVGIGPANSALSSTLQVSQQGNNVDIRVESAADKTQSISFGGNTAQAPTYQLVGAPYGFRVSRENDGTSDFNTDKLVIDREEPLGTFKKRLFTLNKDGELFLPNYLNCSVLNTVNGKVGCAALSHPWKTFVDIFGTGATKTYVDSGINWITTTSSGNLTSGQANSRIGIGTTDPASPLQILNDGSNALYKNADLTSSNTGYMMIGGTSGVNMVFDTDTIQVRSGANSGATLELNPHGGNITLAQGSTGRVGINTPLPSYNLEVSGTAGKTGGGSWTNSSDIRLKDVIGNYDKGLEEIMHLKPVEFKYKQENARGLSSEELQVGFVAQEVRPYFPESISIGEDGYLDFNMHAINVALVNAVQEQQKTIEALQKRLDALENL